MLRGRRDERLSIFNGFPPARSTGQSFILFDESYGTLHPHCPANNLWDRTHCHHPPEVQVADVASSREVGTALRFRHADRRDRGSRCNRSDPHAILVPISASPPSLSPLSSRTRSGITHQNTNAQRLSQSRPARYPRPDHRGGTTRQRERSKQIGQPQSCHHPQPRRRADAPDPATAGV